MHTHIVGTLKKILLNFRKIADSIITFYVDFEFWFLLDVLSSRMCYIYCHTNILCKYFIFCILIFVFIFYLFL